MKIFIRMFIFNLVRLWTVCAVTELLQMTLYSTVIKNWNISKERKWKKVFKKRIIYSHFGTYMAWNITCMLLDQTNTISCTKSVVRIFLTSIHYPNFSIINYHCINNDQHNGLCHEVWLIDWPYSVLRRIDNISAILRWSMKREA